jgi:hypothetical protein
MEAGEPLLLVCAYESEAKCREAALAGAISYSDYQGRRASLPRETELIFYCA